jgi:hypothetical protein
VKYKIPRYCPICQRGPIANPGGYVNHVTACRRKRTLGIIKRLRRAQHA